MRLSFNLPTILNVLCVLNNFLRNLMKLQIKQSIELKIPGTFKVTNML